MKRSGEGSTPSRNDVLLLSACCATIVTLVPVAMYQTGLLQTLPDPPLRAFDSERIASSKSAHPFGVPDALLGLASFGTTLGLIFLSKDNRLAKKLLGVKLTLDAAAGAFNACRQVVSFGRLCSCCTGTAIGAGVTAYAGRDIIRQSWRSLKTSARRGPDL